MEAAIMEVAADTTEAAAVQVDTTEADIAEADIAEEAVIITEEDRATLSADMLGPITRILTITRILIHTTLMSTGSLHRTSSRMGSLTGTIARTRRVIIPTSRVVRAAGPGFPHLERKVHDRGICLIKIRVSNRYLLWKKENSSCMAPIRLFARPTP